MWRKWSGGKLFRSYLRLDLVIFKFKILYINQLCIVGYNFDNRYI